MNKLRFKNPDDLKTDIDQLIDFEGEEKLIHTTTKTANRNLGQLRLPSKYATVLTCSFEEDAKRAGANRKMLA